jgi:hypothetical protein
MPPDQPRKACKDGGGRSLLCSHCFRVVKKGEGSCTHGRRPSNLGPDLRFLHRPGGLGSGCHNTCQNPAVSLGDSVPYATLRGFLRREAKFAMVWGRGPISRAEPELSMMTHGGCGDPWRPRVRGTLGPHATAAIQGGLVVITAPPPASLALVGSATGGDSR